MKVFEKILYCFSALNSYKLCTEHEQKVYRIV